MKAPKVKDLQNQTAAVDDDFSKAVAGQRQRAATVIRKTFSIEQRHMDHLVKIAAEVMAETGKTVSASEALRIVIEMDMERGGK